MFYYLARYHLILLPLHLEVSFEESCMSGMMKPCPEQSEGTGCDAIILRAMYAYPIPHKRIWWPPTLVQNRNLTAETPRTQRSHFLFVPVQPEQIKSPLSRQNTDLLQSHSHQMQTKSIPEGMSFVIRSRQRRD